MDRLSCGFEVKFADGAPDGIFSGYGAVFGNEDSYRDVLQKGCFRETLRDAKRSGNWPAMLLQHGGGWMGSAEDMTPIGIWTELREDDVGLYAEGKLAIETARGRDAYALLKMKPRPALNGLSIGYRAKEFTVGTKPDEAARTLKKVELVEVSLVTFPANDKARIGDVKGQIKTIREFEAFLRDAGGFSHAASRQIAERGFKSSDPRDEDDAMSGLLESLRNIKLRG